jgi:hypothetical protein
MRLEPGMRVRCVDATDVGLRLGGEYAVLVGQALQHPSLVTITGGKLPVTGANYYRSRFKPIVRVKAPSRRGCCNKGCNGCPDFAFRARLHRFATSGDLA